MISEEFARLEKLVEGLLAERSELLQQQKALSRECDVLREDKERVAAELDRLLDKLDQLDRSSA